MGQPDVPVSEPPGYFQHNCYQWALFSEMFIYTSSLSPGEKSLPREWWQQNFLETTSVTKIPYFHDCQQVPWTSLLTCFLGAISVVGNKIEFDPLNVA